LIGIANGTLREVAYKDRVGELTAHQLSTGSAIALFAGYFEWLARFEEAKFEKSPVAAEYAKYKARTGRLVPRLWV